MNYRQRQLRKFYMAFTVPQVIEFLWYTNGNSTQTTLRYYGSGTSVRIPQKLDDVNVTQLECTTFYGNTTLTSVTIPDGITKINWF